MLIITILTNWILMNDTHKRGSLGTENDKLKKNISSQSPSFNLEQHTWCFKLMQLFLNLKFGVSTVRGWNWTIFVQNKWL